MAVRGWATGCKLVAQGSEIVTAASIGATTLEVEWVGDFDDEGGTLLLNGTEIDYTTVDTDAETITLDAPLADAAAVGDRVDIVSGGQVLKDYTLFVAHGDGADAEIDIPFSDRDTWPEGDYDDPVEVILSDDLERIERVDGVAPTRDATFSYMPAFYVAQGIDVPIPHNTWTIVDNLFAFQEDRIVLGIGGIATVLVDGTYDIRFGATFASSSVGSRAVRLRFYDLVGGSIASRQVKFAADGSTALETNQLRRLYAGQSVAFEVWQTSGASLDLRGSDPITTTPTTESVVRWVGPL